jgi:hypothetical protein
LKLSDFAKLLDESSGIGIAALRLGADAAAAFL